MSEWKEVRLGDICTIVGRIGFRGYTAKDLVETKDKGAISLSPTNIANYELNLGKVTYISWEKYYESPEIMVQPGDIVFSKTGTVGWSSYIKEVNHPMTLNPQLVVFKDIKVNPVYLSYVMRSHLFKGLVKNITGGSAVPTLSQKDLGNLRFPIADDTTQDKIAEILSFYDDKIAVNCKICEKLEEQAQALFKHWFVDFAPFKDGKFVESELGMIPEGWRVGTLSEYVDNLGGYSYKGEELQPSTTAMATIKNFVRGGGFKTEGYKEIVVGKKIKDYQYVNLFDVLVAHTDLTQNAEVVGNPAIILSTAGYDKLVMSMDLTKVVPKDSRITSPLLHSILSTRRFKEHALGYVNGTTVLHMNKKAVPDYTLAMPVDISVLSELTDMLDDIYKLMAESFSENIRLASLRDALLPKLMSGQIKL